MVTTTEFVTEKERRYGIGYRPISNVSTGRFVDDSIFMPEKEEVVIERRISVPEQKIERKVEIKEEKKVENEVETGLSVKSKLLVGLYVCVACILSAVAMVAGIMIGNRATELSALESQVRTANAIVRVQEAQIDELSSVDYIEQKAIENGMVKSSASGEIELLPVNEDKVETTTNLFDNFCDWVSGVIGG